MAKFADLVNRKAEEIERPPLLPIGEYVGRINKPYSVADIQGKDGTPYERIEFPCMIDSPIEVDEDDLVEFGNVSGQNFRVDFLLNNLEEEKARRELTLFNIRKFLEAAGVLSKGMTLEEGLANCVGGTFGVTIGHRPDPNNPEVFYIDVKKTYAL